MRIIVNPRPMAGDSTHADLEFVESLSRTGTTFVFKPLPKRHRDQPVTPAQQFYRDGLHAQPRDELIAQDLTASGAL